MEVQGATDVRLEMFYSHKNAQKVAIQALRRVTSANQMESTIPRASHDVLRTWRGLLEQMYNAKHFLSQSKSSG